MLKFRQFLIVLFLTAFFSLNLTAKDVWTEVESKNFNLVGNANEKDIRLVATKLEQFRESFRLLFKGLNLTATIPTNVIVFKNDSAFHAFKPKLSNGKIDDFVAGYFQPGRDVNYITLAVAGSETESPYRTIFHEYVHFIINTNFGKSEIPAWFNEGLAEYYATYEIEKDQILKLGIFQQRHLDLLRDSQFIPLKTLFEMGNYQMQQTGSHSRSIFYAESWALIHYLFQTGKSGELTKFIDKLLQSVPPEKAFQETFQVTYADLEKELRKYVGKSAYQYQIYPLKNKLTFDADMKASPLSESDADAYLGDLLVHSHNRSDDAEPYLQKALELNPDSSMANTSMGMLKMRQRKWTEAKRYLEQAIKDNQKNHLAYYNYAVLLSKENRDEFGYISAYPAEIADKMMSALTKAIELNPAYTESYELLAFVNLVNNQKLDESVALLKKSLAYQPGNEGVILRIAEIWLRQQKFDDAKLLAEKIANSTDEPEMKSRADSILSNVNSILDIQAKNAASKKEYEARRKDFEQNQIGERPNLTRRTTRDMTSDEYLKFEADRKLVSINQALKKPLDDEKQIVGKISKITCPPKAVNYLIKTPTGTVNLFSRDFQNLTLVAFDSLAENAQIACNANLEKFNAVLTYKSSIIKPNFLGELIAVDFVPENFRILSEAEQNAILAAPTAEVVGDPEPPPTVIVEKSDGVEDSRRKMISDSIKRSLHVPQDGEIRISGTVEKIECDQKGSFLSVNSDGQILKFKTTKDVKLKAFTPEVEGVQFGCGTKALDIPTLFTYKPAEDKKTKTLGNVILIEFLPKGFKLE